MMASTTSSSKAFQNREIERALNLLGKENQARAKIYDKLQERKVNMLFNLYYLKITQIYCFQYYKEISTP